MAVQLARRAWLGAGALLFLAPLSRWATGQSEPKTIRIVAHKFQYEPSDITLKKGEPVVLELMSQDVTMGFNIADFNVRTDIAAGQWTRLALTPDRSGDFIFFCDVFCGSGHEEMEGRLHVTD